LHEERELEKELGDADSEDLDVMEPRQKRRRGGELGRDWRCDVDGCDKDFKSVSLPFWLLRWLCSTCERV